MIKRSVITIEVDEDVNKRYYLKRTWGNEDKKRKRLTAILHNPNIANNIKGDKSSNLCMNKAVDEGCNELVILNLYATRGNRSSRLPSYQRIVEVKNLNSIENFLNNSDKLLLAWGDHPGPMIRNKRFISLLKSFSGEIRCFRINRSGEPCHASMCGERTSTKVFDIDHYFGNK